MLEHPSPLEAPRNSTFSITVSLSDIVAGPEILCSSAEEHDLHLDEIAFNFSVVKPSLVNIFSKLFPLLLTMAVKTRLAKTLFLLLVFILPAPATEQSCVLQLVKIFA